MHNSIGKSTLLITASKLVSLVINMVCVMLLSRIRTLEEYGTYSQLLMAANLASTLMILGLPNGINYFLAKANSQEERSSFLNHYFTLNTILCAGAGLVLVFCSPLLAHYFKNEDIHSYIFFLLLYPFASITMSAVESILIVYERPRTLVLYRLLNSLSLLGILVVADSLGLSFRQYMVLFLATELLFALAVYALAGRLSGGLRFAFDSLKLQQIAEFCIPIGLATAVGTLSTELDKLVISHFFSTAEYAIYTNAAKELPLTVLASATTMVVMPKVVQMLHKNEKRQAVTLWQDAFLLNFTVMAVMVSGIVTFAPEVITILYSEKYLPGVTVFRVYTLLLLIRCIYFGMFLNALGKTKYIFRISVLQLIVNIVLNIIFCIWLGFIGPAIATVVAIFMGAVFLSRRSCKELDIPIRALIPWKGLLSITAVNFAFAMVFMVIKQRLHLEALVGTFLQAALSGKASADAVGECAESVLLGIIWVVLYAILLTAPVKKKWKEINQQGGS